MTQKIITVSFETKLLNNISCLIIIHKERMIYKINIYLNQNG